jgi:antitoxin YefM
MSKSSKTKNMTAATYSHAREHLAEIWDFIEDAQQPIVLHRRGHQDMALLPADELVGLQETAHLLRSPKNAARLLAALHRSYSGKTKPITVSRLRQLIGIDEAR